MNISFARLGVEECEFCVMHANHSALCENAQSYDVCQKRFSTNNWQVKFVDKTNQCQQIILSAVLICKKF